LSCAEKTRIKHSREAMVSTIGANIHANLPSFPMTAVL
jgi:hypothetical protein